MRGAIVYLTQANHSSYKTRQSQQQLRLSVELLYKNYNAVQRDSVIFFHTGDVSQQQQQSVLSLCVPNTAQFRELPRHHFQVPASVVSNPAKWQYARKFSVGYRHMIRFFTLGIWETIHDLGYEYVMRLDEDSYIWSPINYNIFEMMQAQQLDYVYRMASWERGNGMRNMDGFHAVIRRFAQQRGVDVGWLSGPCAIPALAANNHTSYFSMDWCGNMYAIYNNFFASSISFWRQSKVRDFLDYVDRSGTIYTERYGDALWHSAALSMFLPISRLRLLDDFAYEHSTLIPWVPQRPGQGHHKFCRRDDGSVVDGHRDPGCITPFMNETGKSCLAFGGIALASSDAEQPDAMSRMANLSLALLRCPDLDMLYRFSCMFTSPGQQLKGVFAARVTLEQPVCSREPKPYYCAEQPFNTSRWSSPREELENTMAAFNAEIQARIKNRDSRMPPERAQKAKMHTIDNLFQWRQMRAACVNWCNAALYPSPRETLCHQRARKLWARVASAQPSRSVAFPPPPPMPPLDWATSSSQQDLNQYKRWKDRQRLQAPRTGQDWERYEFANGIAAPGR